MVTFVFDSSAVVRYLDDKAGASRVQQILEEHAIGNTWILISSVQWGEIARIVCKRHGVHAVSATLIRLETLGFEVKAVFADHAVRAAILQNDLRFSYADAFLLVLAQDNDASIILTADFDFKLADHLTPIEFLPPNPS